MFLSRVEIDGVRGFESFALDLHPRLTVLVGPNGCGKTTVLDAIVAGARGSVHVSGPTAAFVTGKERGEVRFTVVDESGVAGSFMRPLSRHGGTDGVARGSFPAYQQKTLWLCFGAGRTVVDQTPGSVKPQAWSASEATKSWWEAGLSFDSFFKWMREREDLENERVRDEKGLLPELLAVRAAVNAVVPEYTDLRVRRTVPGLSDTPLLMLKKHQKELPFDALSEGERMLIVLVADIARRMTMMAPHHPECLDVPALILIDEIELHLHPKWQREILNRLQQVFPNAQFVVTTHSPIVVSEIERENLRVLNDFKLVTVDHGRGRDVNQILEDTFGVPIRTREIQDKYQLIKKLVDDESYDAALEALDDLEKEVGDEPDVIYYRTLATRFRAASVHE